MNDITLQVAVSSVFNNTVKLHKSVQLFHKNPNNVTSMISPLPVNDSSVKILSTTETSIGSKFSSYFGAISQYIIFAVLLTVEKSILYRYIITV